MYLYLPLYIMQCITTMARRKWTSLYIIVWIIYFVCAQTGNVNCTCDNRHHEISFPHVIASSKHKNLPTTKLVLLLKWRQEFLQIQLHRHNISPETALFEWRQGTNLTEVEALQDDTIYFQGYVKGKAFSYAALAYAVGFMGYIQIDNEGVYMKPLPIKESEKRKSYLLAHSLWSCGNAGRIQRLEQENELHVTRQRRSPSSTYTKYVEVLVAADTSVVDFVGKNRIKDYIMGLMNIVNTVYHDATLGTNIEVVTVKILHMDKEAERKVVESRNPQRTVDQFCQWVSTQTYTSGTNHDVAVLLTRSSFAPAGYAPITGMCVPMRNCALVKDDGFTSSFVIAHEMAHIFGLMHDGHGNNCNGREYTTSIMATIVQSSFNHYWWSGCSKTRMAEVIGNLQCLNNNPYSVIKHEMKMPLGMSWSLDEQCKLEFGSDTRHCSMFTTIDPCSQMWCTDPSRQYSCKTKNVVPLEGTQCGRTPQWYCADGACGYHGDQKPVHGEWSQWTQWSNCSAICGFGFKKRSRSCDSPEPEYGGNACDGESDNIETCAAKECDEYQDSRAHQCRLMDVVPVRGQTHKWLPYQVDKDEDKCKLTCISATSNEVVTFDSLVDNGTPCMYSDPGFICLDGKCVKIGCDGVRDSNATLDPCGICRGNGTSCKEVSGVYKRIFEYSAANGKQYETILTLPKGARKISIAETATLPHFLSLQDTLYYENVLNGNNRQGHSKNFVLEGSWFQYVNNQGHETISSHGPIHRDVNLMIYPMDYKSTASVRFMYLIGKDDFTFEKNKYKWMFEDWSVCSVSCGTGVQHIIYGCYDKDTQVKVADEECLVHGSRKSVDVKCEMIDCASLVYFWRMLRTFSVCSASCGSTGIYHRMYECERITDGVAVNVSFCANMPVPINKEPCNRIPCQVPTYRWNVTSQWSTCSATCGEAGRQHQLYYCIRDVGNESVEVAERFCSDLKSPKESRPCNHFPCVSYKWYLSESWNPCNETCGQTGVQTKTQLCNKYIGDKLISSVAQWYCNGQEKQDEIRSCNRRSCFTVKWVVVHNFSSCSHSCGTLGVRQRDVVCKNVTYNNDEKTLPSEFCEVSEMPIEKEECNRFPCEMFYWQSTNEWTNCSSKCGSSGYQKQIFVCMSSLENSQVDDYFCSDIETDSEVRACNQLPCYTYAWKLESQWYPECSTSCQHFVEDQYQVSKCYQKSVEGQEEMTKDVFCNDTEKPAVARKCEKRSCPKYYWKIIEEWSNCTGECGNTGIQSAIVYCVMENENGTTETAEVLCNTTEIPSKIRECEVVNCLRLEADDNDRWTPCSSSCGTGIQYRQQSCLMRNPDGTENQVDIDVCENANLVRDTRECNSSPCHFLEWGVGSWSMCSRTCGPGQEKRQIYCGDPSNPADPSRCPDRAPDEYRPCNDEPCQDRKPICIKDRAAFCDRAHVSLCGHVAYQRVCCKSCAIIKEMNIENSKNMDL